MSPSLWSRDIEQTQLRCCKNKGIDVSSVYRNYLGYLYEYRISPERRHTFTFHMHTLSHAGAIASPATHMPGQHILRWMVNSVLHALPGSPHPRGKSDICLAGFWAILDFSTKNICQHVTRVLSEWESGLEVMGIFFFLYNYFPEGPHWISTAFVIQKEHTKRVVRKQLDEFAFGHRPCKRSL